MRARLVHFSTDYVFAGDRQEPYREDDPPRPLSRYGWSKWQGELRLAANLDAYFLFRISWLYGVHGPNFVCTMLKIFREKESARVVNDQFGSPTYAAVLAANIAGLIASGCDRYGVYHYCDRGVTTWFDFAAGSHGPGAGIRPDRQAYPPAGHPHFPFPGPGVRPAHSVLDNHKAVRGLGFRVHDWRDEPRGVLPRKGATGKRPSMTRRWEIILLTGLSLAAIALALGIVVLQLQFWQLPLPA